MYIPESTFCRGPQTADLFLGTPRAFSLLGLLFPRQTFDGWLREVGEL